MHSTRLDRLLDTEQMTAEHDRKDVVNSRNGRWGIVGMNAIEQARREESLKRYSPTIESLAGIPSNSRECACLT
jgi:hypothetical protein